MKRFIRHYAIDTYALYLVSRTAHGLLFDSWPKTLLIAGLAIMGTSLLAKPVINLLLLPLNIVTFGLFRWVSSAVIIYIVTLIVPGFKVVGFNFPGYSSAWIDIPALSFTGVAAYIGFSFIFSLITSFIYWIVK
jgi:putative membrane protein